MNEESLNKLIERALLNARQTILKTINNTRTVGVNRFGDTTFSIDVNAENAIINEFKTTGEGFTIITEESGIINVNNGGKIVVVDPLDGSRNAVKGIPTYSISIAIANGRKISDVITSGIIDVIRGDIIHADQNGVFFNKEVRKPSNITDLKSAYVSIIIKLSELENPEKYSEKIIRLLEYIGYPRFMGSAALESAYVSIGLLDAFIDIIPRLRVVDLAASLHMARVSGAYAKLINIKEELDLTYEGRISCIIASNEKLASEIIKLVL
ncbi:MAG: inositol monophosphatase family protein [Thermoprotei archaeon]